MNAVNCLSPDSPCIGCPNARCFESGSGMCLAWKGWFQNDWEIACRNVAKANGIDLDFLRREKENERMFR